MKKEGSAARRARGTGSARPLDEPWRMAVVCLNIDNITLAAAADSHVGCVRRRNDDSFAALPELGLFAVADGMGGKPGGDVASRMAVDALRQTLEEDDPDETWPRALERGSAREEAMLLHAFRRANAAIFARAIRTADLRGMGTTLTALLVRGRRGFVAHVGDSRIYRLRAGALEQITADHSLVATAQREGMAVRHSEARAAGVLMRAVGTEARVDVDTRMEPIEPGDTLLLCTDGLWQPLHEEEIAATLSWWTRPEVIVAGLIGRALERGAPDNVTCVVVRCSAAVMP